MKILVCRPKDDADKLSQLLRSKGYTATSLPCINIDYIDVEGSVLSYTSYIFTSKYAVESLFAQYNPELFDGKKIYSVGQSTAKTLKKYGLDAIYPYDHGSQELLKLILKEDVYDDSFAVISGVSGNELLVKEISQLTKCDKFETYRRVFESVAMLSQAYLKFIDDGINPDIIVTTSIDIFKSLNRIFDEIVAPEAAIVTITSPKMLEFVNEQGFENTLSLERLDNDYICQKVREHIEAKNVTRKKYSARASE
ncbi:uroporphyrinogen-III synthase [Francisella salimarina]|uniref:uroporphyrinogen-III synthase n=1 Tax=Francisella salimarina TaxID=2599927 RepID=UPI0037517FB2